MSIPSRPASGRIFPKIKFNVSTLGMLYDRIMGNSTERGAFMLIIRNETPADRQAVEDITRRAFYILHFSVDGG